MKEKIIEVLEKYLGDVPHISAEMIAGEIEDLYLLYPTEEQEFPGIINAAKQWNDKKGVHIVTSSEGAKIIAKMFPTSYPLNENHD